MAVNTSKQGLLLNVNTCTVLVVEIDLLRMSELCRDAMMDVEILSLMEVAQSGRTEQTVFPCLDIAERVKLHIFPAATASTQPASRVVLAIAAAVSGLE